MVILDLRVTPVSTIRASPPQLATSDGVVVSKILGLPARAGMLTPTANLVPFPARVASVVANTVRANPIPRQRFLKPSLLPTCLLSLMAPLREFVR